MLFAKAAPLPASADAGVIPIETNMSNLTITNPRKSWVAEELTKLIKEWEEWQEIVSKIEDQPYV